MPQINTKSLTRIAAISTLYNFESNNFESDIETAMLKISEFYKDNESAKDLGILPSENIRIKVNKGFLKDLVSYSHQNLEEIDLLIAEHLKENWKIDQLSVLLRSLLRIAIGEIKFFPETPIKVIISEYTNIASDMLDESEIGFVNSLLDNCATKMRNI